MKGGPSVLRETIVAVVVVVGGLTALGAASGPPHHGATPSSRALVGTFVDWVAVDDAHGYAHISVTNHGEATETAVCHVFVSDDFGDFGFDALVGLEVQPGRTVTGQMPISVGKRSRLINAGKVTDC